MDKILQTHELYFTRTTLFGKTIQWRKLDTNMWKVLPNIKEALKTLEKKNQFSKTLFYDFRCSKSLDYKFVIFKTKQYIYIN